MVTGFLCFHFCSNVDEITRLSIANSFDGCPPVEIDPDWAPDQRKHYYNVKDRYQLMRASLLAFFSGQPDPLHTTLLLEKDRHIFELMRERYLSLYGVIYQGWRHLENCAYLLVDPYQPTTPGELFAAYVKLESAEQFNTCLEKWCEFVPGRWRSQARDLRKLGRLVANKSLTPAEQKTIRKIETKFKRHEQSFGGQFVGQLIDLCSLNNEHILRQKIKAYRIAHGELLAVLESDMHSRKRQPKKTWRNGSLEVRSPPTKEQKGNCNEST